MGKVQKCPNVQKQVLCECCTKRRYDDTKKLSQPRSSATMSTQRPRSVHAASTHFDASMLRWSQRLRCLGSSSFICAAMSRSLQSQTELDLFVSVAFCCHIWTWKSRRFCSDIFSVSGLITRISAASDFCRKEVTWSESSACVSKWTDANDACEMNCFVHWPRSISSRVFEQSWILYLRPHALELGELERLLKKGDLPKSEYLFNNLIQFASSYCLTFLSSSYPSLTARVLFSLSIQASTSVSRAALRWVGGPASIVGCPLPG